VATGQGFSSSDDWPVHVDQTTSAVNIPLAIVFADIAGSTRLYERLGNTRAQKIVDQCLRLLTQVTERYEGTIVKKIGDELMCTFETPDSAARAASDMQRTLKQAVSFGEFDKETISIRVGFHYGPVIRKKGDVFGDAVNVAARVAAQAKAHQILTTKDTLAWLDLELRSGTRYIDSVSVKGKTAEIEIHEVLWEFSDLTIVPDMPQDRTRQLVHLRLQFGGKTIELDQSRPSVKVGRGEENDIIIPDSLASRLHARIELRRDKFMLIDQSLNGTYVCVKGEREVCLRRDELSLTGSGVICLGRSTVGVTEVSLLFSCD
jgi:class 3 adenylate cyclase